MSSTSELAGCTPGRRILQPAATDCTRTSAGSRSRPGQTSTCSVAPPLSLSMAASPTSGYRSRRRRSEDPPRRSCYRCPAISVARCPRTVRRPRPVKVHRGRNRSRDPPPSLRASMGRAGRRSVIGLGVIDNSSFMHCRATCHSRTCD